ncbi:hypothetical protein ACVXG9_10970 [Escherichia coli]
MAKRFSGHHRRHRQSGDLMKLESRGAVSPDGKRQCLYQLCRFRQPPGGNNFALAQSGSGNSANRTDFKPQKANTSEIGTKWQVLDKRLLLTAAVPY